MLGLTTHVLDIYTGVPAQGVKLQLWKVASNSSDEQLSLLAETVTNQQGRAELAPTLEVAEYVIYFFVGDYFKPMLNSDSHGFLTKVPVRFFVADASQHYHVPLVTSPWAYSTYRGS
jgi:5-hydroxyisourate hydrolase